MNFTRICVSLCGAVLLFPLAAFAQNNTAGTAASYFLHEGGRFVGIDTTTNTQRWYKFNAQAGRSFCVEVYADEFNQTTADSVVDVFRANGTTSITGNDDNFMEPGGGDFFAGPSRACYVAGFSEANLVKVTLFSAGTQGLRLRISDTTLFSPWWYVFTPNGYDAFITMANTTNASVSATVTARISTGAVVGTIAVSLPPNGNTVISVGGFGVTSGSGSASIAHNGGPGAIAANITTLSPVTGLSFDAPFTPRQDNGR